MPPFFLRIVRDWRQLRHLRHTSMDVTISTPLLEFWAKIANFKSQGQRIFPTLVSLAEAVFTLPVSNATVERAFSMLGIIKTKLRNHLAIPMVEAIMTIRYGLRRRGETCDNFEILPEMLSRFNQRMYDHKRAAAHRPAVAAAGPSQSLGQDKANEICDDVDMSQVLADVEELFGKPILIIC